MRTNHNIFRGGGCLPFLYLYKPSNIKRGENILIKSHFGNLENIVNKYVPYEY